MEGSCELGNAGPLYPGAPDSSIPKLSTGSSHLPHPGIPFLSKPQKCQAAANSCLANQCSQLGPQLVAFDREAPPPQFPRPSDPFPRVFIYFPVSSSFFLSLQLSHTIALSLWALILIRNFL